MDYFVFSTSDDGKVSYYAKIFIFHFSLSHCAAIVLNSMTWIFENLLLIFSLVASFVHSCQIADLCNSPKNSADLLFLFVKQAVTKFIFLQLLFLELTHLSSYILFLSSLSQPKLMITSCLKKNRLYLTFQKQAITKFFFLHL